MAGKRSFCLQICFSAAQLLLMLAGCGAICVENGEYPVRMYDLNCTGSEFAGYCCPSPRDAVNSSTCLPYPWRHDACQGGFYAADNDTLPCPDGFYCPENALCMVKCSVGAFCKTAQVWNSSRCSASTRNASFCCNPSGTERIDGNSPTGIACGGASTNQPCSDGYYCPSTSEQVECPESHYCRRGSTSPQRCPSLSSCNAGSKAPVANVFSLVLSLLLALILAGFVLIFRYRREIREYLAYYLEKLELEKFSYGDGDGEHTPSSNILMTHAGAVPPSVTADSMHTEACSPDHLLSRAPQSPHNNYNDTQGVMATGSQEAAAANSDSEFSPIPIDEEDSPPTRRKTVSLRGHRQRSLFKRARRMSDPETSSDHRRGVQRQPSTRVEQTAIGILSWVAGVHKNSAAADKPTGDTVDGMQSKLAMCKNFIVPKSFTMTLEFTDISLTHTSVDKVIVDNVTGSIRPGNLTAIMGSSGTGKTSLLNCLCGKAYYAKQTGELRVNGKPVRGIDQYRSVLGFVPQDDVMHTDLTVHEVLSYQAALRLPRSWSSEKRKQKVTDVMTLLSIDHVKDATIGTQSSSHKISGGQRKRVSIGMELVSDPTILFLDEPTSGLDSVTSKEVVELLQFVANQGKLTVVMVIHQPRVDIFDLFDDLILMEKGGRVAFQGSPTAAAAYFKKIGYDDKPPNVNPADYYLDAIDTQLQRSESRIVDGYTKGIETVADIWEGERTSTVVPANEMCGLEFTPVEKPYAIVQFLYLLERFFWLMIRTWYVLAVDLFLVLLAGGVLGALFKQVTLERILVANVMTGLATGLTGMIAALRPFGEASARPVFWREASAGVNRISYFCAVMVGNLPAIVLYPIFFLTLYYTLTSPRASFGNVYALFLFNYWAVFGIGYLLSTTLHPDNSKMGAVVVGLIGSSVPGTVSTSICKLQSYTFIGPLIYSIYYSKWLAEGLFEVEANQHLPVLRYDVELLAGLNDYSLNNLSLCLGALFAIGCVTRVLALFALLFTHRGEQK